MRTSRLISLIALAVALASSLPSAQQPATAPTAAASNPRTDQFKRDVGMEVDAMGENIQKMNDMVFSFAEPGFQEFETSKYLTTILKQNGFTIQEGIAGIPTAWTATLGQRQAGDRARLRHRRHPAGVAEAGRRLARADHRRRAGSRRGAQLRACRCRSRRRSRSRK